MSAEYLISYDQFRSRVASILDAAEDSIYMNGEYEDLALTLIEKLTELLNSTDPEFNRGQ